MAEEQNNQNSRLQFEDIVPWGQTGGDTGLSSRLKLKRNFERIKLWADNIAFAIQNIGNGHYLSKEEDDEAAGEIGFLKGFWVKAKSLFGIDGDGNAKLNSLTVNEDFGIDENGNAKVNNLNASGDAVIDGDERVKGMLNVDGNIVSKAQVEGQGGIFNQMQSPAFGGHTSTGSGWGITDNYGGTGRSRLTIDELYVRGRFIAEQLEAKKKTVSGGDELQSCAASYISSVDIIDPQGNIMGYQRVKVPWLLGIKRLLSGDLNTFGKIWSMTKNVYVGVTESNIREMEQQNPNGLLRVRCYFLAKDGEREIDNWWRVGDLAFCQTLDLANQQNRLGYGAGRAHSASSNIRWWRKVVAVSQTPYKIGSQEYHWFDVEFNMSREALLLENSTWCEMGSDIPAAHDSVVQLGHMPQASEIVNGEATDDATGRMNALSIEVNGAGNEDAPCVKILYGIYGYSLQECWFGGPVVRMLLSPRKGYFFYGPEFHFITQEDVVRVVIDRPEGEWSKIAFTKGEMGQSETYPDYSDDIKNDDDTFKSRYHEAGASDIDKSYIRKVHYWERVTHKGALWLCIKQDTSYWYDKVEQKRVASPNVQDMSRYERRLSYVSSEPSVENSEEWLRQVNRGTGVVSDVTLYAASEVYVVVPQPDNTPAADKLVWYPTWDAMYQAKHPVSGWWIYEKRTIIYTDTLEPKDTYKVTRWGIDGNGIFDINNYFLGRASSGSINQQNDTFPMEPGSDATQQERDAWNNADANAKWFDSYDAMVAANGGLGIMQDWYVWTKTVVIYDEPKNENASGQRRHPVISYVFNRIGVDGQIGQGSFYCLRSSDKFSDAFGGTTYAKCGIKWYSEETDDTTDTPATHRFRLASSNPINREMWKEQMPNYAGDNKKYLWSFEYSIDGKGTAYASMPVCIGNHARGIKETIRLYACSTSQTPRNGGKLPNDIYQANGNSDTNYYTDPTPEQLADLCVWDDEAHNRVVTESKPYQWKMVITKYTDGTSERTYEVAVVRGTNGEDGAGEESIFFRVETHNANNGAATGNTYTDPNDTTKGGQYSPNGVSDGSQSYDNKKDDWVPKGWSDNPQGIDITHQVEYRAIRKLGTPDSFGRRVWGNFCTPEPYSNFGKNGQDGDGQEYVFMRTKKNVAPIIDVTVTTDSKGRKPTDREFLPSITNKTACDAESVECSDDYQEVTSLYPFAWYAFRKKVKAADFDISGKLVWKMYTDGESSHAMKFWNKLPDNAIRIDLTNQADLVSLDSDGKVRFERTVVTKARIFDGSKIATSGVSKHSSLTAANMKIGTTSTVTVSDVDSSGNVTITWTFKKGDVITAQPKTITLVYTKNGVSENYSADFTLGTTYSEVIYQVEPSPSQVSFSRKSSDNTLTPGSISLKCNYTKTTGSGTTVIDNPTKSKIDDENYLYYRIKGSNGSWGSWTPYTGALTVSNNTTDTDYEFCISTASSASDVSDSNAYEREVVPIVKDGENGDGIKSIVRTYAISNVGTTDSDTTEPAHQGSWSASSPAVTEQYPYLWAKEVVTYKYGATTTKYYCMGSRGDNGIDAKDVEWVYVRTTENVAPTIVAESGNGYKADDFLPLAKVSSGRIKGGGEGDANVSVRCTDDPQGVNDTWKYEWEIRRNKGNATNGHREWLAYSGTMTLHNNLSESSFVIDIDNDNDQFGVDADGKVLIEQKCETVVSMLYGTQEQAFIAPTGSSDPKPRATLKYDDGTTPNSNVAEVAVAVVSGTNSKEYKVTVTIKATGNNTPVFGSTGKSGLYVDISGTCAKGTRSIRFTLEKVMSGEKGISPTIYQLALSQKSFAYSRDANNNLVAKSNSVKVNVKKTVGNSSSIHTSAQTGDPTFSWGYDDSTTAQASGQTVGTTITVSAANASSHSKVWFLLSTGDREEVPIVKDGANGGTGSTIWQAQAFKRFSSAPGNDKPTKKTGITASTTDFDNGWKSTPPAESSSSGSSDSGISSIDYSDVSSWKSGNIITIPSPGANGNNCKTISFVSYGTNAQIQIRITASSEQNWDFGAISNLDPTSSNTLSGKTASAIKSDSGTLCSAKVSGTGSQTVTLTAASAGNHSFQICYAKDASGDNNNDNITVEILTETSSPSGSSSSGKIYSSVATVKDGTVEGDWSTAVEWNGEQGPEGKEGVTIVTSPGAIIITQSETKDSNDVYPIDYSNVVSIKVYRGNTLLNISNSSKTDGLSTQGIWCTANLTRYRNGNITVGGVEHNEVRIKLTAIYSDNSGNYPYNNGAVTVTLTIDGTDYAIKVPWFANLLGTFKTQVVGDVEESIAEKITYGYNNETGSVGSLQAIGKYIRSSEKNISRLEDKVDGIPSNVSDIAQTVDDIKMTVSGNGENLLPNSAFEPADGDTSGAYTPAGGWEIYGSSSAQKSTLYKDGHVVRLYSSSYIRILVLNQSTMRLNVNGDAWNTLSFYWRAYSSSNAKIRVYFDFTSSSSTNVSISEAEVDGVQKNLTYDSGNYYVEFDSPVYEYVRHTIRFKVKNYHNIASAYIRFQGVSYTSLFAWPQLYGSVSSGIDIKKDVVDVLADNFTIHNSKGEKTAGLNEDGDFEVSGTIRAKNFFHRVCVTNGVYYSPEKYYYNGSYYDDYDSNRVLCTYDADVVYAYLSGNGGRINLPRPEDFQGKLVTIFAVTVANAQYSCDIKCVNNASVFVDCVSLGNNGNRDTGTGISSSRSITTGRPVQLLSMEVNGTWYWVYVGIDYGNIYEMVKEHLRNEGLI